MKTYLDLLNDIEWNGANKSDRTGTGTRSLFGYQMHFDLSACFPLLTTKKMPIRLIIYELLWFLRGDTNIKFLQDHDVHIWDEWADDHGELGLVYGSQWCHWGRSVYDSGINQIERVIDSLKNNPDSRRHIVSAWNVDDLPLMALPPCHILFQFYVANGRLSCHMYQRSADVFLGLPFNIASYALLTMMVAHVCELQAKELIISLGDTHLYSNHVEQAKLQCNRKPYFLPTMQLNPEVKDIFEFTYEDFTLSNYKAHPAIAAPISV